MKKEKKVRYQYDIRYSILPGKNARAYGNDFLDFCQRHHIGGVTFFTYGEENNRGHLTEEEINDFCELFQKLVPLFKKAGIRVSVNPWTTLGHTDRGRSLRQGQDFLPMVSPSGKTSTLCASPASSQWRKYLCDMYARFASCGFDIIWIEDDWRFHNHGPLDWGGDFSPQMLKHFSHKIGKHVTREDLLKNILKPGRPHPWRKVWLETWRDISEANSMALRDAVQTANPKIKIGLMSSSPDTHNAEGRDWTRLFHAISINGKAFHRPHFAPYRETLPLSLISSGYLLDLQKKLRPSGVSSYPEIENYPFGLFSKSATNTWAQMAIAQIFGSEGLLFDLFSFGGKKTEEEPGMGKMLDCAWPAIDFLAKKFSKKLTTTGAGIPFIPESSSRVHLMPNASYGDLVVSTSAPANLLGACGIAFTSKESDSVNLLFGRHAWSFTDNQIYSLLSKGLFLDAGAAEILTQRGFNRFLGATPKKRLFRDLSLYAIEKVVSKKTLLRKNFPFSVNLAPSIIALVPDEKSKEWTEICDPFEKRIGAGLTLFHNSLGGRIAISACDLDRFMIDMPVPIAPWNMSWGRRTLMQSLIRALATHDIPLSVTGDPWLYPIAMKDDNNSSIIAIFNLGGDPSHDLQIHLLNKKTPLSCTILQPLQKPINHSFTLQKKEKRTLLTLNTSIDRFGLCVLTTTP
ncbi:MAG: hypothetical protein WDA18_02990 [Candidatus Ratteibacteria bacterium]|jgi:hypothetical protein